ncbi:MAG: DUF535 family protein [Caulobacteraceae bacterium]|nr:DUF535 family protein [Caulobacter sp.]
MHRVVSLPLKRLAFTISEVCRRSLTGSASSLEANSAGSHLLSEVDVNVVSAFFDADYYLSCNVDVAEALVDPLDHYRLNGWIENRDPSRNFDNRFYRAMHSSSADYSSPLDHYASSPNRQLLPRSLGELVESKRFGRKLSTYSTNDFLKALKRQVPIATSKPYSPRYLIKYLSASEKLNAFAVNVAVILDSFLQSSVTALIEEGVVLLNGENARVRLQMTKALHAEGDLTLSLESRGESIYELSFSIIEVGKLLGETSQLRRPALLISRLQGVKGGIESHKDISANFGGVQLPLILLSSAQGIADALGLVKMYGVLASHQLSFQDSQECGIVKAYNDFFALHGGMPVGRGLFELTSEVSGGSAAGSAAHRRRARRRRGTRSALRQRVRETIAAAMCTPESAEES